jgi:hypothetical protein
VLADGDSAEDYQPGAQAYGVGLSVGQGEVVAAGGWGCSTSLRDCGAAVCDLLDSVLPMIQARNNGKAAPYPIEKSFWKMVSKDGPVMREDLGRCWIWTGWISNRGYGYFRNGLAHRRAYELFKGEIPKGMTLDHLCRIRCCVNPDHLDPVTNAENHARGRTHHSGQFKKQVYCKRGGHLLEGNRSERGCKICFLKYNREYQRKRRARD